MWATEPTSRVLLRKDWLLDVPFSGIARLAPSFELEVTMCLPLLKYCSSVSGVAKRSLRLILTLGLPLPNNLLDSLFPRSLS